MSLKKVGALIGVLAFLICFSLISSVWAFSVNWSHTYGGYEGETAYSVVETSDGGFVLAGSTGSFDVANGDFWLVKTDKDGNLEWNQSYGGYGEDTCYALIQTVDGGYALAGSTMNYGAGGHGMWLVKTDVSGNVEWNKTYGISDWDKAYSLIETSDGGYALAGETYRNYLGNFLLVKTDANGNMEWNRTYGGDSREIAYSVVESNDGGFALAGYTWSFSSAGNQDVWLVKTDKFGNLEWYQTYGGAGLDIGYSLIKTLDGSYALAGITNSYGDGDDDIFLVKTDINGNLKWSKTYGSFDSEGAYSLIQLPEGGYALAGYSKTSSFDEELEDGLLIQIDENGNLEGERTYGNFWNNNFRSIIRASDGNYVIAGKFVIYSSPESSDFWLVKTKQSEIISEFSSWTILPLLLVLFFVIIVSKNKFRKKGLE